MKVIVYSTPTCLSCGALKEWLKKHKIKFKDVDISKNSEAIDELIKKTGEMTLPVTEIRRNHSVEIIVGFDVKKLKDSLGTK